MGSETGGANNECSGHGTCSESATCTCKRGYVGKSCELTCPLWHGLPCGCTADGSPGCRGTCLDDGTCKCTSRFSGPDCSVECMSEAGVACSGHGSCDSVGTCNCVKGWTGERLSLQCCLCLVYLISLWNNSFIYAHFQMPRTGMQHRVSRRRGGRVLRSRPL